MFFLKSAGVKFTDRGNVSSADFIHTDLTKDADWHTLDLSGIIPTGTKLVGIRASMIPIGTTAALYVKTNGNANDINQDEMIVSVTGAYNHKTLWVVPDADGKIEYWLTAVAYATITLTVGMYIK